RIRVIARTEIAAHVFRDHTYPRRLQPKHVREIHFWAKHSATARIEGDSARTWLPFRYSRSDLHGYAGNTRDLCVYANDVRSPHERIVGGCSVADFRIKGDIRIHFRPDAPRSGFGGIDAFGTGR